MCYCLPHQPGDHAQDTVDTAKYIYCRAGWSCKPSLRRCARSIGNCSWSTACWSRTSLTASMLQGAVGMFRRSWISHHACHLSTVPLMAAVIGPCMLYIGDSSTKYGSPCGHHRFVTAVCNCHDLQHTWLCVGGRTCCVRKMDGRRCHLATLT